MKACGRCKVVKDATAYHKDSRLASGLKSWCKECARASSVIYYKENREELLAKQKIYKEKHRERSAAQQIEYRKENRDKRNAKQKKYREENRESRSARRRSSEYGLAPGDFERMLAEQGRVCAICGGPGGKKGLNIDHDHDSGKIRALLCSKCNFGLGNFNDSSELALKAAKYLKLHGK